VLFRYARTKQSTPFRQLSWALAAEMNKFKIIKIFVYASTFLAWLALCYYFWQTLIRDAAGSPETYTQTPSFQALNFLYQYSPFFIAVLFFLLLTEWLVFLLIKVLLKKIK